MIFFQIKVVHNPEDDGFLAYVNFERPGCAKKIRRTMGSLMRNKFGKRLAMDPTGVLRDQEGKYIPDRFNRIAMAYAERYRSPPSPRNTRRRVSRSNSPRSRKRDSKEFVFLYFLRILKIFLVKTLIINVALKS